MNQRDVNDWREWVEYLEERDRADAELEREVPIPAYSFAPVVKTLSPQTVQKVGPVCECGAAKCKTTHAHWCPAK